MSDTTNNTIPDQFLSTMLTTLKEAKDFSMEQLPLVAQEILHYNFVAHLLACIFCLLLIIVAVYGGIKIFKFADKPGNGDAQVLMIFPAILGLVSTIVFMYDLMTCVQIYVAPRMYLIEYVSSLLKH